MVIVIKNRTWYKKAIVTLAKPSKKQPLQMGKNMVLCGQQLFKE